MNKESADKIAESVRFVFKDDVQVYVAGRSIAGGDDWEEELLQNLVTSDALITLLTPKFTDKSWFYIEWSPFWIAKKPYFILLTDETVVGVLDRPVTGRQFTYLFDILSVQSLFVSLHKKVYNLEVPIGEFLSPAQHLVESLYEISKVENRNYYDTFRSSTKSLPKVLQPVDFEESERIISYFISNSEDHIAYENSMKLDPDDRGKVARLAVLNGNLDTAALVAKTIFDADSLRKICSLMIKNGYSKSEQLIQVLALLDGKSTVAHKEIAVELVEAMDVDNPSLRTCIEIIQNGNQVRDVLVRMIGLRIYNLDTYELCFKKFVERKLVKRLGLPELDKIRIANRAFFDDLAPRLLLLDDDDLSAYLREHFGG
ncbi:hypothetical protein L0660_12775 [Dyadobacter sp. CY351]|nr:hypothetical protein [Dyadobacter sp. CY351]